VETAVQKDQIVINKEILIHYEEYASDKELSASDATLLNIARAATADAYAPYSHFRVGAAARLKNGEIITGANQENASFPAGLCAERTLLSVAAARFPGVAIDTLAISYHNVHGVSDRPISPCGICRQSLQEFEQRTGHPIRLLLGGQTGRIYIIPRTSLLLPLAFTNDEMR
jgi:cytidine deaminase